MSPDNRFLALRAAGQEATDFALDDEQVARFIELRDGSADQAEIEAELGLEPEVVAELVRADEAQALAHRIAIGDEPMYPAPAPSDRVRDERMGGEWLPIVVLVAVMVGALVYAALR